MTVTELFYEYYSQTYALFPFLFVIYLKFEWFLIIFYFFREKKLPLILALRLHSLFYPHIRIT